MLAFFGGKAKSGQNHPTIFTANLRIVIYYQPTLGVEQSAGDMDRAWGWGQKFIFVETPPKRVFLTTLCHLFTNRESFCQRPIKRKLTKKFVSGV